MKTLHLSIIVTLIMSVIFLMTLQHIYASTCAYSETSYSTPQFFLLSDNVFVGTVTSISNYTNHEWKVHFSIEKIWKGVASQKPTMVIANSLQGCGYSIIKGEKYLVYTSSEPFLHTSWTKPYADAQNDIALLDDPKFQAEEKIKEELNKKLKAAKGIIESMMISKRSKIPFNAVGVDEINSVLHVGIDNTKATLSAEEYQKKLKEILGDISMTIGFGQISSLLPKNTTDNFIGNDLVPPVLTSPLKQFKSGIAAEEIICKEGLNLVIKIHNHQPACVKPETKQKLIERGWGFDNNFLTLIEESDRIITGMVTDVEKYDNGRREVFLGVYEWLKNGTNAGAFLELDDIKNKETSKIDFKRGEKVLLFLKDIDENRGARDIFYTEKILPAKYPISLRDKVFSLVKPEDRGIQTRYQYDENCSKRDLFGDSYMYCTYEEKDARFYVPIDITAELVRNKLLEHVSEKYLQEHFDLKRAYDQAVINGHITPSGQVMEFEYKLDDMTFLYLANISLSYSEVYLYYAPPREIQSLQYAEKMNDLIHSCFEPDTIVVFWDKVAVSHIENGFSPVITGAGPPAIYDRHGNTIQNHEKHFRFWPETGEIECSQGMQELPNKIKMQDKELLIDTTQFLKFKL